MRIKVTARRIIPKAPNSENDDDEDTQSLVSIASDSTITNVTNEDDDYDDRHQHYNHDKSIITSITNKKNDSQYYVEKTIENDTENTADKLKLTSSSPIQSPNAISTTPPLSPSESSSEKTNITDNDLSFKINSRFGHYICTKCNRKFKNKNSAIKHAMRPSHCSTCNRQFCNAFVLSKHIWKQHNDMQKNDKELKCELCDKYFATYTKLKQHESQHIMENNESDFTYCEICEKSVKGKYMFERHIEKHQREIFKCTICYKGFETERKLDYHIARECDNLAYHVCKICGKKITSVIHFGYHMNMHSGEKPFYCDICEKGYIKPCIFHPVLKNKKLRGNHDDANQTKADDSKEPPKEVLTE